MKSLLSNSRRHDISFHVSGRIDISSRVARKLSLAPGDVIDIVREDRELYICVKLRAGQYTGRHQGRVWTTANGRGTFRTCSRALAAAVLMAGGFGCPVQRCPCGNVIERDNKKYITIIYRCSL